MTSRKRSEQYWAEVRVKCWDEYQNAVYGIEAVALVEVGRWIKVRWTDAEPEWLIVAKKMSKHGDLKAFSLYTGEIEDIGAEQVIEINGIAKP